MRFLAVTLGLFLLLSGSVLLIGRQTRIAAESGIRQLFQDAKDRGDLPADFDVANADLADMGTEIDARLMNLIQVSDIIAGARWFWIMVCLLVSLVLSGLLTRFFPATPPS